MSIEGVDFSWGRPNPSALVAAGKAFVLRYVGNFGGKSATRAELDSYTRAGLGVGLIYEEGGRELLGGLAAGIRVAKAADAAVNALGYPGVVIYFNVDFDATETQQNTIHDALDGIASVIGRERTGLYGGYWVIKRAFDAGKITWGFQTYAWSGGRVDPRAHLYQYHNGQKVGGADVDFTRALQANFGQVGSAVMASGEEVGHVIVDRPVPDIQRLVGANPDGIYGPDTTAKVKTWQSAHHLNPDGIWGPLSDAAGFPKVAALDVDGKLGPKTITRWQQVMHTPVDGVISTPSELVAAVQRHLNDAGARDEHGSALKVDGLGIAQDGHQYHTVYALQSYLGTPRDGVISSPVSIVVKSLQARLNAGKF